MIRINDNLPMVYPICINLKERRKKRTFMKKQAKKQKIKLNFFTATKHSNPKRGCLESHLTVIENAIKEGHNYLFILEDDAKFIKDIKKLPPPPDNWDMLYLGGTVKHIMARENEKRKDWVRMTCWTTHAYIINLQNKELIKDIFEAKNNAHDYEIDKHYVTKIHHKYRAYMICPMICIQKSGYSDIEEEEIDYDFMEKSIYGLRKPPHEITKEGSFKLKYPEIKTENLPSISIITPTKNREWIFSLPFFNLSRFIYPKEKIEWIIIDSSSKDNLKYSTQGKKYIKYIHVDEPITIAKKRNIGCKMAKNPIIVHMDDDDIYFPTSILARVKAIVGFKNVECVGCSRIAVYDIVNDKSFISSDGHLSLSEASMAYTKRFWEKQQFDPGCKRGEYRSFLRNRLDMVMDIPYIFVMCAINHTANFTPRTEWINKNDISKQVIRNKETGKEMNFKDSWQPDLKDFMESLRTFIKNRNRSRDESKKSEKTSENNKFLEQKLQKRSDYSAGIPERKPQKRSDYSAGIPEQKLQKRSDYSAGIPELELQIPENKQKKENKKNTILTKPPINQKSINHFSKKNINDLEEIENEIKSIFGDDFSF